MGNVISVILNLFKRDDTQKNEQPTNITRENNKSNLSKKPSKGSSNRSSSTSSFSSVRSKVSVKLEERRLRLSSRRTSKRNKMSDNVDHKKPFTLRKLDAMSAGTAVPVPAILEAQSDFALNLLRQQNALQSTILSPISISIALAMVVLGAKDETAKQIRSAIAKDATDEELHSHFAGVVELLQTNSLNVTLDAANRVYVKEGYKILDTYMEGIKKHYGGQFEQVDFAKSQETANKINQFVEEATRNKIKNLISPDALNELTRLVLVNAVYFKGDWEDKFNKNHTIADHDFYVNENETKKVEMMTREAKYIYYEANEYQVLGLPYKGENVFMFVILPKEKNGLNDLLTKMNGPTLAQILRKRAKSKVNVKLPKFKIESSFNLGKTLESLGITDVFTSNADLSGITGNRELYVSQVVHKAFVETNEEGSEAAGASGVVMTFKMLEFPHNFHADHSFLFSIVDDNGHQYFTGTYTA